MPHFRTMTAEQLRTLREARGLTREALAKELGGCTAQAIVKWERNERPIPQWVAEKMLNQTPVTLPMESLSRLLNYASANKKDFNEVLSAAIANYLRPSIPSGQTPQQTAKIVPLPKPPELSNTSSEEEGQAPSDYGS